MEKVVLAYSGGLDTSYCVKYLRNERNLEVHSAIVNTGGFTADELSLIEERAYALGVTKHYTLEVTDKYYNECLKYLVFGNVLKNHTYPLSVSAERVFQATAISELAKKLDARYLAHGSTGAGNDQVRFDLIFKILFPEAEIITPIRDLKLSREAEIEYLKNCGVKMDWSKADYSINKGIWGTSVGGKETLTSHLGLPESAYPTPVTKQHNETITLSFTKGELTCINDFKGSPVACIHYLNELAAPYGVGRDMHVGDTIIGIKGRVAFEAAAPMIIIKAHQTLEKHVLTKWQQYWKDQLSNWYGNMLHEGLFLDPLMRNIETFMTETQKHVSGNVMISISPYRFSVTGIDSPHDMMSDKFGKYGEMNTSWTGEDVKGFSKILGNQVMIYHKVNELA